MALQSATEGRHLGRSVMAGGVAGSTAKTVMAGGVAGCTAKTVLAPLERARILLQVGGGTMKARLKTVAAKEGVRGLWAGNLANLTRIFPMRGIAFATNDLLNSEFATESKLAKFATGGISGLVSTGATYPLDLVRGRQAAEVAGAGMHNFGVTLVGVARREGPLALWRGAGPTLIGSIPYEGIRFGVVELIKGDGYISPLNKAVHGAAAGLLASILTFPNDTIRRILQQRDVPYAGYFHCARHIYQTHGVRRFYFGIFPSMIKAIPSAAIQFGVFDLLKR